MSARVKRNDPDGFERLVVLLQTDAKRTLARIAFESQVPMADMARTVIDEWLIKTQLPVGVKLPRRLEALRTERGKSA